MRALRGASSAQVEPSAMVVRIAVLWLHCLLKLLAFTNYKVPRQVPKGIRAQGESILHIASDENEPFNVAEVVERPSNENVWSSDDAPAHAGIL